MRVGLKLLIPPIDGIVVSVKAKDTLSAYASKYKSTVQKIVAANGLSGSTVTVGQTLVIPCTPPAIPVASSGCQSNCGSTGWNGGKLRWPVPASRSITQYYSSRHPAIDIGAPTGDTGYRRRRRESDLRGLEVQRRLATAAASKSGSSSGGKL